jgi:hypothetical protein
MGARVFMLLSVGLKARDSEKATEHQRAHRDSCRAASHESQKGQATRRLHVGSKRSSLAASESEQAAL